MGSLLYGLIAAKHSKILVWTLRRINPPSGLNVGSLLLAKTMLHSSRVYRSQSLPISVEKAFVLLLLLVINLILWWSLFLCSSAGLLLEHGKMQSEPRTKLTIGKIYGL